MGDSKFLECETELKFSFPLDGKQRIVGRDNCSAMQLEGMGISAQHAIIHCDPQRPFITDNDSTFGIRLDGIAVQRGDLSTGMVVTVGLQDFHIRIKNNQLRFSALPPKFKSKSPDHYETILIGRGPENQICLAHPLVSRCHASFTRGPDGLVITDKGSTNGTFVNGKPVRESSVHKGDTVHIGPFRFTVNDGFLQRCDEKNRIRIEAINVSIALKGTSILRDITATIEPGAFVALLGSSGAGKTTLSRVLTGEIIPRGGKVLINGLPVEKLGGAFGRDVGYVSQHNLLRPELTVFETFVEQALLRLPGDVTKEQRGIRVEEVIELLELTTIKNRRVGALSGGEAKRVHIGVELLASPAMVVLDEPLAGLDPGLITRFMKLFRRICDRGQTLLLTTHTLQQIDLCDRIVFLHKGKMLYEGVPAHLCENFGVSSLAEVYERTAQDEAAVNVVAAGQKQKRDLVGAVGHAENVKTTWHYQFSLGAATKHYLMLLKRYCRILLRDRRNLLVLLAQAPLITLFLGWVYRTEISFFPIGFYFCLTISGLWIGGINSVKEFAREWYLIRRERRAGMVLGSFILAKLSVELIQSVFQALVFAVSLVVLFKNISFSFSLLFLLCVTMFCGSLIGLTISAFSATVPRAISALPIVLIPQIFFSGILTSFDKMSGWGRAASHVTFSRPLFSVMKQHFILELPLLGKNDWITLFYLSTGLIILMSVTLHGRTKSRALRI